MPRGKGGHMKLKKITALMLAVALATSTFSGCAMNKDATVATLDDTDVSLGLVNFMIRYQQASFDDMYIQYGGEGYWNQDMSGNGTVLETWKESTIEQVHEFYTLKAHMDEYDVKVSDEEKSKIEEAAKKFMDDNSEESIEELGATQEIVEEYLELQLIKNKMYKAIVAKADTEVTDEEANMAAYSMIKIDYSGYYDQTGQMMSYSEEEIASFKDMASTISESVSQGQSLEDAVSALGLSPEETVTSGTYATYVDESVAIADSSTDAEADDTESTEASEEENVEESVYTANTIDQAVVDALNAMEEGQTSELIDTGSVCYIVRLDSKTDVEATETNRQTVKGNKEDKFYNTTVADWQDKEDWTVNEGQLDKIKIHNYFTTIKDTETTEATESTETLDEIESTEQVELTETTEESEGTETVEE